MSIRYFFENNWDLYYTVLGKTSVQSSELDAKSDTNEIKLMVTDHADGNRISLSALYIIVPQLAWSTLIGPGMSRLGSHWSRASETRVL